MRDDLLHGDVTEQIIGGFYEVHYELGGGFLEYVYLRPLIEVLCDRGLVVEHNARLPVHFRGKPIAEFRPDLVINQVVIVELKARRAIEPADEAQIINYLRASNIEVALLLNFGAKASFKRHVYANSRKVPPATRDALTDPQGYPRSPKTDSAYSAYFAARDRREG